MNDFIGKFLNENRIKNVMPYINGKLLDIGCGFNKLVRMYQNGIGVDVFDWGDVDLIVEDTSKLPFADKSFDTISVIASLNHTDKGRIIITMLSPMISRVWHKIREPWDEDQVSRGMKEGEVFGLTKNEIIKLFSNENFKLIKHKKFMLLNTLYIFGK
jgi:hypothetical protein